MISGVWVRRFSMFTMFSSGVDGEIDMDKIDLAVAAGNREFTGCGKDRNSLSISHLLPPRSPRALRAPRETPSSRKFFARLEKFFGIITVPPIRFIRHSPLRIPAPPPKKISRTVIPVTLFSLHFDYVSKEFCFRTCSASIHPVNDSVPENLFKRRKYGRQPRLRHTRPGEPVTLSTGKPWRLVYDEPEIHILIATLRCRNGHSPSLPNPVIMPHGCAFMARIYFSPSHHQPLETEHP